MRKFLGVFEETSPIINIKENSIKRITLIFENKLLNFNFHIQVISESFRNFSSYYYPAKRNEYLIRVSMKHSFIFLSKINVQIPTGIMVDESMMEKVKNYSPGYKTKKIASLVPLKEIETIFIKKISKNFQVLTDLFKLIFEVGNE